MKIVGRIRPTETREIRAEAETYEEALEALKAQVPEGWTLLQVLTER